ncbi:MAG: TIR domain-containing protein [Betaproteobacteria bacterium]|nr:MAG: TIR domain-containing protein [Betaproteobacteria bacterium]
MRRGEFARSIAARARGPGRVSVGGNGAKYWAFISYSHRDTRAAVALQRALETYRLPRRLVGTRTAVGEVPVFTKPVFRDRDEMEAGADLKATVREALAQSRWLIVVCSPAAARSPWVNREIIEFKKLHGEQHVLACIAAGEPFASRERGREAEECFPEALRFALTPEGLPGEPLEPIAADLRPQGDGRRRAMLKLVAGMVGVGVDELVHRDAQRRARRMAVLATASLAGMAVMAVLTVMAVQSRVEAQNQRAQAEDLIEFMLGDLRRKLDAVGRLDVLDSVGAKALAYYAKQEAGRLDADALGHRARAMHLIGEMGEQRGHLVEALAAFQSAADTTAQLLARAPSDGKRIFDHAQSVYWVGYIAWKRGQAQAAEEAFLKYRELAQQLVRIDPDNIDWRLETAYANQNLGVVQLDRMRPAEALQSFAETRQVRQRLVGARPELAFELADSHGWIAKAHEASGDYGGAIAAQRERIGVLRAAGDSIKDRRVEQQLANANYELGRLHLSLGDAWAAVPFARVAVQQADALSDSDSANLFWLSQASFHRLGLAEIELALGNPVDARANVARVMAELPRLLAGDAASLNWQIKLKGRGLALSTLLALAEGHALSTDDLEAYVAAVRRFESPGKQMNAEHAIVVAAVELLLGDALDRDRRHEAASAHWRSAAGRLQPFANTDNYPVLTLLARLQLRLGQHDVGSALAERLQASNYRHPATADLVNELSRGAGIRPVKFSLKERRNAK